MSNGEPFPRQIINTIQQKIFIALIDSAFKQTLLSQAASILCALVILLGFFTPNSDNTLLFDWFAFFISVALFRIILNVVYKAQKNTESHLQLWTILFLVGATLGGCSWGIAGSMLFAHGTELQRTFIIILLAGVTSGAVMALTAQLVAALVFISAALLPLIVYLIMRVHGGIYDVFEVAVSAYYLYTIVIAIKANKLTTNNFRLCFENEVLLNDLTQVRSQLEIKNKQLEVAATHDPLTGLANRHLFEVSLSSAIQRADRNKKLLAVFYIDLDNFKSVNDVYGHQVGDLFLKVIAERMRNNIRASDMISRLGGDEFTVIMEDFKDTKDISKVASHVCKIISEPFIIDGVQYGICVSIGISIYPLDSNDADTLIKNADDSMYAVKQAGGNNYRYFSNPDATEHDPAMNVNS